MNRRQLLQSMGFISAHAMFPSVLSGFLASCASPRTNEPLNHSYEFFSQEEMETVVEVIDLIIPATKTKSASEVNTQFFLDQVFAKCMVSEQQEIIKSGLKQLKEGLEKAKNKQRYLEKVDKRAYTYRDEAAYFRVLKQYTLIGFFTSQEGTTQASNYIKIPDGYKGEIPMDENTLNYGKTNLQYHL